ncbi:MAG: GGDEF domain-containing protein [Betaproteobacteria bacterium]
MKNDTRALPPIDKAPSKSLTKVLGQSEHVKDLVEECAEELTSVNVLLKQELADRDPVPGLQNALHKSDAVEGKVQYAADQLSVVNQALEAEVRERHVLEHRLTAVTEEGDAARHAAIHDPLTGMPNRVLFKDRLDHGLEQAKRHGRNLALMFVDLDEFKNINDSYGHDVGDSVLQTIATRLMANTRGEDTVSRHGGDEFLYLLMEISDEQHIALIAKKIVQAIQAPCDIHVRDLNISLSINASIGVSIFPKDGTTGETLLAAADKAMYTAKRNKAEYSFAQ